MPRPKKAGGPEPKKRSRNGCWPCKARKVKCDELHPVCQNCQRQGETCDYSIRLNWEGRGSKKKDLDISSAQTVFSSASAPSQHSAASFQSPPVAQNSTQIPFQPYHATFPNPSLDASYHGYISSDAVHRSHRAIPPTYDPLSRQPDTHHRPPYGAQSRSASYERARTSVPDSYRPAIPRLRSVDNITSSPAPNLGPPTHFSFPNTPQANAFMSPSTPPRFSIATENSPGLNFASSDRAPKRPRYDSIVRSPRSSFMLPPGMLPPIPSGMVYNTVAATATPHAASISSNSTVHNDDAVRLQHPKVSLFSAYDAAEDARRKPSIESLLSGPSDYASTRSSVSTTRGSFSDGRASFSDGRASFSNFSNSRSSVSDHRDSFSDMTRASVNDSRMSIGELKVRDMPIPEQVVMYGVDRGHRDLDIGKNIDADAVSAVSSISHDMNSDSEMQDVKEHNTFAFGLRVVDDDDRTVDYYTRPVNITFPHSLQPLPQSVANPMDLLYFHHFVSHTACLLVPHNCSLNPFRDAISHMALNDKGLMCILLVYSAYHRACILRQPLPMRRISLWLDDTTIVLRRALHGRDGHITTNIVTSAILLLNLDNICPGLSTALADWDEHLETAHGIVQTVTEPTQQGHTDAIVFLITWHTYLTTMAKFVGGSTPSKSTKVLLSRYKAETCEENDFRVDRSLGLSPYCGFLLASMPEPSFPAGEPRSAGTKSVLVDDKKGRAQRLIDKLELSLSKSTVPQIIPSSLAHKHELSCIPATTLFNLMYHHAGILYIQHRVLGLSPLHVDVTSRVLAIFECVLKSTSSQACLLFPMFVAGCAAQSPEQRTYFLEKLEQLELHGVINAATCRATMKDIWKAEDLPIEAREG